MTEASSTRACAKHTKFESDDDSAYTSDTDSDSSEVSGEQEEESCASKPDVGYACNCAQKSVSTVNTVTVAVPAQTSDRLGNIMLLAYGLVTVASSVCCLALAYMNDRCERA